MNPITPSTAPLARESDQQLREAARALEGVFVSYMFKAMRETVPSGGVFEVSHAQDMFTSMFDESIAEALAQRTDGSLGDALYEQLRRRILDAPLPR